jgi:hypothetical protein
MHEEILQQQDNSNEQFEITAMMIQSATNESSNATEEGSSSSAVESQPKYGRGSLVQQVARRVERCIFEAFRSVRRDSWTPYHQAYGSKPYERLWHTFYQATQTIMCLTSCRKISHQLQAIRAIITSLQIYGRKKYSRRRS